MMRKSIFVSIVSYRDPLLVETLKSLMEQKSGMYDVIVGIFEQINKEDSLQVKFPEVWDKYKHEIRYKRIDPEYPDGVGWARAINALQIQNEDFYYQIDSHEVFDPNWDRELVKDYNLGVQKFNTDKVIITAGCKMFRYEDGKIIKEPQGHITSKFKYFCFQENWMLGPHGDYVDAQTDLTPAIHISAGNFFTHTDWHRNVGLNGRVYFEGEEQIMTLTSFVAGYYMCHPRELHAYHLNDTHTYITKQTVQPVIDMNNFTVNMKKTFAELHYVINSISDENLELYRKYSGVDYINRKLERRAITKSITMPENVPDTWTVEDRLD